MTPLETDSVVQANDFARQWRDVGSDVLDAVDRVGRSGWLILGAEVERFEQALADWWGVGHAVGVASGMDAIEIALRCAGVTAGDGVLTTPLTAFATTLAIMRVGATPIWCDVDPSGLIDLESADAALASDASIRYLLPVHLYGQPLDPNALRSLVDRHGVTLIEDCAQSAGASRMGNPTGKVGRAAALSLYPTKNLGAMGDGGVLLTDDAELAARARVLRDYGQSERYQHQLVGFNSRLDELHAAILYSAFLPRMEGWLARRREIAGRYLEALEPLVAELRPVHCGEGSSAFHLFPVEVTRADPERIRRELRQAGIMCGRHYPLLCPEQPAAAGVGRTVGTLDLAKRLAEREVSLPIHPYLDDSEIDRVIAACTRVIRSETT